MTLIFFMGSDYAIGGVFVAGLDCEILYISRFDMCNNMRLYRTCICRFIIAIAYKVIICLTRNLTIVFHNHDVGNPSLGRYNMVFP